MPNIIHTNPDKKAMDIFSDDQIKNLEESVQILDPIAFVESINYDTGIVEIGRFGSDEKQRINVACDSVPAAFKDVLYRVFNHPKRCPMPTLSTDQLKCLEKAIQLTDRNVYIAKTDYLERKVYIGIQHNVGTVNFFKDDDFLVIDIEGNSVPDIFNEVFNRVYNRCM